jgi:peptidoglycan/xylan/chitin deacetylase (PgdA/CDA1 family)
MGRRLWTVLVAVMAMGSGSACSQVDLPADEVPAPKETKVEPPEPIASFVPPVVHNGLRDDMRIALTFDACPTTSEYDARITRVLKATNTPATIFLSGSWVRHSQQIVLELANNPLFELANHSYTHKHMTQLEPARALDELLQTQAEIFNLTGQVPEYFRPPFGEFDGRLSSVVGQAGLTTIEYDLASGDPDEHATKERLVAWVLKLAKPGSIVVMHINHKQFHTADALPDIIQGLRKRGYSLVTVGQLLKEKAPPLCVDPRPLSPLRDAVSSISAP